MEDRLIVDTFNRLKNDGQNSVDNLIQWMKDANIIDGVKVTEAEVRKQFSDVQDPTNVDLDTFKRVLSSLVAKQSTSAGGPSKTLADYLKTGLTTAGTVATAGIGVVTGALASSVGDAIKGAIGGKSGGAAGGKSSGAPSGSTGGAASGSTGGATSGSTGGAVSGSTGGATNDYGPKSEQSAPVAPTSDKKDTDKEESEREEESEPEESEREEESEQEEESHGHSEATDPDEHSRE